jgi:hypothetical protein
MYSRVPPPNPSPPITPRHPRFENAKSGSIERRIVKYVPPWQVALIAVKRRPLPLAASYKTVL